MKKYAKLATVLTMVGLVLSNALYSFWMFNQPKAPKLLSK